MNHSNLHQSVFLNETINLLQIKPNGTYLDCTFGRGGHSELIAKQLNFTGVLVCIDRDTDAITYAKNNFKPLTNVHLIHDNFMNIDNILKNLRISEVDGFVYDLGVSSPQFDNVERGFSYHGDNNLDMRMDQTQTKSALTVVNEYSVQALATIFNKYGECKNALNIAKAIAIARQTKQITTTAELVEIIKNNIPKHLLYTQKHPAKTYFQAIRIEVNDEFESIKTALIKSLGYLKQHGRMIVLTFHSLEDKLVKEILRPYTQSKIPNYLPVSSEISNAQYRFIKAPKLSETELLSNKRARSARMHIIERN